MSPRREFPRSVKAAIVLRSLNKRGQVCCEGCSFVLGKKPYHIDHTIPDALYLDKSRPLTAADGKLLGWDCCHKPKTAIDQGDIAKVKRIELRSLGIKKAGRGWNRPPGVRWDWKLGRNVKEAR